MKKILKSLPIYLLPLIGIIFYSCIDDPVNPDGNMINGTIYDKFGFKKMIFQDAYFISPGDQPVSIFPSGPNFSIYSFTSPYDLVITTNQYKITLKFQDVNLKNINPVFYYPEDNGYTNYVSFVIQLRIPPARKQNEVYFVKLISNAQYVQERCIYYLNKGDSILQFNVNLPYTNLIEKLSGQVMIFKAENWTSLGNIDFTHFGIKESDTIREYSTIVFEESDLLYNPPEIINNFKNIPPLNRSGSRNRSLCLFQVIINRQI